VSVPHGHVHSGMSENPLEGDDVSSLDYVVTREGMAEVVKSDGSQFGQEGGLPHIPPEINGPHPIFEEPSEPHQG